MLVAGSTRYDGITRDDVPSIGRLSARKPVLGVRTAKRLFPRLVTFSVRFDDVDVFVAGSEGPRPTRYEEAPIRSFTDVLAIITLRPAVRLVEDLVPLGIGLDEHDISVARSWRGRDGSREH